MSRLHAVVLAAAFLVALDRGAPAAGGQGGQTPSGRHGGQTPSRGSDARLQPLRDLDGVFPFTPSATPGEWETRAAELRRQVRVAVGLWPWPSRTPLNAVVHGGVARDGYRVERVFFESMPGHFVTGSLYRPTSRDGRLPAVLSPHGHWPGGRFQDVPEKERREQLASGAERFDNAARHLLQARAVQLARMGTVVFLYDMVGYADSVQIPQAIAHSPRGGRQRTAGDAGLFFGVDTELQLASILGLQIWNAVRALDFLTSLPDVDPHRLAVTGASGGGTQTFILGAIDDRPAVLFPAVMVSTRMQGGCTCENADYLRIGTGNVELAALVAPKPLGMTAADDWTRLMPREGYPELQRHYAMLGARDRVGLFPFLQFDHNYNHVSRTAMYGWLNRHLGLGLSEPVLEQDFEPLSRGEATVWTAEHPAPGSHGTSAAATRKASTDATVGEAHERAVTSWWRQDAARQMDAARPRDAASLGRWRDLVGGGVSVLVARGVPEAGALRVELMEEGAGAMVRRVVLHLDSKHEQVSFALFEATRAPSGTVVWTSAEGFASAMDAEGRPTAAIQKLLDAGHRVLAIDVLGQGAGDARNRLVENQHSAAFTFGYNRPLVAQRAHDVLAAVRYAKLLAGPAGRVTLVAADPTATLWSVLARAQAGNHVDAAAFVSGGVRFAGVTGMSDASFLPGSVKYGDVPAMLTLGAPGRLWVAGETADAVALVRSAYAAAGAPAALTISRAQDARALEAAINWINGSTD